MGVAPPGAPVGPAVGYGADSPSPGTPTGFLTSLTLRSEKSQPRSSSSLRSTQTLPAEATRFGKEEDLSAEEKKEQRDYSLYAAASGQVKL